jgi:hypothetical protein
MYPNCQPNQKYRLHPTYRPFPRFQKLLVIPLHRRGRWYHYFQRNHLFQKIPRSRSFHLRQKCPMNQHYPMSPKFQNYQLNLRYPMTQMNLKYHWFQMYLLNQKCQTYHSLLKYRKYHLLR